MTLTGVGEIVAACATLDRGGLPLAQCCRPPRRTRPACVRRHSVAPDGALAPADRKWRPRSLAHHAGMGRTPAVVAGAAPCRDVHPAGPPVPHCDGDGSGDADLQPRLTFLALPLGGASFAATRRSQASLQVIRPERKSLMSARSHLISALTTA